MAPFDALNLGDHVGDALLDVDANRAILQQAIGAQPIFLSQVHGVHVEWLADTTPNGTQADACITDRSHLACTIMVADCLPVLLTNEQGSRVAAVHAGWRSLAGTDGQGVLENVLECFKAQGHVGDAQAATKIIAWLGPCIGSQAFEVGNDVHDAFVSQAVAAQALFLPTTRGKWLANLQGLARLRLAAAGVTQIYGNDGSSAWCTVSQPSRFFSYRRDRVTGRMAACIWRD